MQDNSNLFTVLERGDRRIMQIKKKCIILVGMRHAGKSATFNWIRRLIMKGVMNKYGTNTLFEVDVEGSNEKAALGSTLASVTLAPNIYHLDDQTTLIDMPSYEERRNYIGVLAYSYFLNAVFEKAVDVKFVIVLDELKLVDPSGDGIIRTFNGFINMFNYQQITNTVKENFLSSVSVVVTRSEQPNWHANLLSSFSEQLKEDAFISENNDGIIELIDSIISSCRIEPFLKARKDEAAPSCSFIDRFSDQLGWTYFPLKESEAKLRYKLIKIPFDRYYYYWLSAQQQMELNTTMKQRINLYTKFPQILNTAMNKFLKNWNELIAVFTNQTQFTLDGIFDLSSIFEQIKYFLRVNDYYNSQELIEQTIKAEYGTSNIITGIKAMLNIYNIGYQINDQIGTSIQKMAAYSVYYSNLVDCLEPFCRNADDQMLLLRLKFVLKRGFREFSMLYTINERMVFNPNQYVKDNCNQYLFQIDKKQYMENLIKPANIKLLSYLFRTLPEIQEFDFLFKDYLSKFYFERQLEDQLMWGEIRMSIDFVKADILLAVGEQVKAALACISAFKSLCSQEPIIRIIAINQHELEARLGLHFASKRQFLDKIIGVLLTVDISVKPLAKFHALNVSQCIKDIRLSCLIFDNLLKDTETTLEKHLHILDDYIRYCLDCERFEDAFKLLQRRLSLDKDSYEAGMHEVCKIDQKTRNELEQGYNGKITFQRLADKDQVLEHQIDKIGDYLQN